MGLLDSSMLYIMKDAVPSETGLYATRQERNSMQCCVKICKLLDNKVGLGVLSFLLLLGP